MTKTRQAIPYILTFILSAIAGKSLALAEISETLVPRTKERRNMLSLGLGMSHIPLTDGEKRAPVAEVGGERETFTFTPSLSSTSRLLVGRYWGQDREESNISQALIGGGTINIVERETEATSTRIRLEQSLNYDMNYRKSTWRFYIGPSLGLGRVEMEQVDITSKVSKEASEKSHNRYKSEVSRFYSEFGLSLGAIFHQSGSIAAFTRYELLEVRAISRAHSQTMNVGEELTYERPSSFSLNNGDDLRQNFLVGLGYRF